MSDANAEEVAALRAVAEAAKGLDAAVRVYFHSTPGTAGHLLAVADLTTAYEAMGPVFARAAGAARSPGAITNDAAGPSTGDAGAWEQAARWCDARREAFEHELSSPGASHRGEVIYRQMDRHAYQNLIEEHRRAARVFRERASVSPDPAPR